MSFDAALAAIDGVEGWLSDDQVRRLWEAGRRVQPPGRIVEIGSFRGRSTIVLRLAAPAGVEVVAVDPHGGGDRGPQEITPDAVRGDEDNRIFNANLERAGVSGQVRHLRDMSHDALGAVEPPFDVLYVDGAHRYGLARADIEQWGERVRPGGTLLVHDSYNAVGVMLAQLRLLFASGRWRYVGRSRSLAEYRREDLSAGARARNFVQQLRGLPWFARNSAIKVAMLARMRSLAHRLGLPDGDDWPY